MALVVGVLVGTFVGMGIGVRVGSAVRKRMDRWSPSYLCLFSRASRHAGGISQRAARHDRRLRRAPGEPLGIAVALKTDPLRLGAR